MAAVALAALHGSTAAAFPENVRYGYASCSTCHASPTGGGVLTPYGREASEEFMGTWSRKGENALLEGAVRPPDWLNVGGDIRTLSVALDNGAYKEKAAFPMQAEVEFAVRFGQYLTGVMAFGAYDTDAQFQRMYLLSNINDHVFVRLGRFFPAFGIYSAEHDIPTRGGLGFDVEQESYNVEAGYMGEQGEIILDSIFKSGSRDPADKETGASLRAAWYAGGKSQVGLSLLSTKGNIWNRQVGGVFAVTGLTKSSYLQGEIDAESKRPEHTDDVSTGKNQRFVTYEKVGWEMLRGLHLLATYEASRSRQGHFDPNEWAAGPGLQWFPRPHFELLGQVQQKYDERWSHKHGYEAFVMGHYYL
jgi:hypothetical protein